MKININRMCQLAGLGSGRSSNLLSEGSNSSLRDDKSYGDEADYRFGRNQLNEQEGAGEDVVFDPDGNPIPPDDDEEAVVEVDEAMLVQELRRAKRVMKESRMRKRRQLSETAQLQKIIEEEVANVMDEYNYGGEWVYAGQRRPRRSRNGYTAQGSFLPGLGFKGWK